MKLSIRSALALDSACLSWNCGRNRCQCSRIRYCCYLGKKKKLRGSSVRSVVANFSPVGSKGRKSTASQQHCFYRTTKVTRSTGTCNKKGDHRVPSTTNSVAGLCIAHAQLCATGNGDSDQGEGPVPFEAKKLRKAWGLNWDLAGGNLRQIDVSLYEWYQWTGERLQYKRILSTAVGAEEKLGKWQTGLLSTRWPTLADCHIVHDYTRTYTKYIRTEPHTLGKGVLTSPT